MDAEVFLNPVVAWSLLAGFSVVWILLGLWWSRGNNTTDDYLFAGRNVGFSLATATLLATWVTGNTALSAPEMSYTLGLWGIFGYCLAGFALIFFAPVALRIKSLIPRGFTSGDFIRLRYGKRTWYAFIIISMAYLLGFLVTQAMGGGLLLTALSGIDYHVGMIVIIAVCTIYTLFGGMRAVIGTDFIQSMLILITLLVVAVIAFNNLGTSNIFQGVMEAEPQRMNLLLPAGLFFAWNTGLFAMGEIFHGNTWWQRLFSMRKEVTYRSFILSGVTWIFVPIVTGLIALVAIAEGFIVPQVNMVFPIVAAQLLGTGGAIAVFIIVFSSLASTIDSLLASTSAFLSQDIYRRMINPNATDAQMQRVAKGLIVFLGLVTIAVAWNTYTSMYMFFLLTGSLVASTIWPIAMGLYWREASPQGAFWSMISGSIIGLISYFTLAPYSPALVGTAVSAVVMLAFTKLKPDRYNWSILKEANKE